MADLIPYHEKVPQVGERVFLAEGVRIIGDVVIGDDSSVFYNAVLRGDLNSIVIGNNTNIQDGTTIHLSENHGVQVGNNVAVGHNAILHGCTVEDGCTIGMGAIVMDGACIRKNSIVGAGALVTAGKEFPENSLIVGSPARVLRHLTEEEIHGSRSNTEHYIRIKEDLRTSQK
ncbi:MAG: gamma carbonic anhydrase family protein [Fibrobacter sp.]|jgi:carbonic anhydrase/acetyltransferase-like protein (isoleucine patch superfamily)|nr:gamma carbonic anhydrase family protein [Fibrobacter sp.]